MFFYKFLRGSVAILGLLFGLKLTSNSVLGAQLFFSVGVENLIFSSAKLYCVTFWLGRKITIKHTFIAFQVV